MTKKIVIRPQAGFQEMFLSNPADIVIAGAGAGPGKTWALLADAARHKDVPGYGAVIFRRTTPQIRNEGGLWDASGEIYAYIGGSPTESSLTWKFSSNNKIKFSHLEYEKNILDWQGAEIPYIGFDEGTHFTRKMVFYLLSRNRSTCGVKPCMRITLNPDPDHWLADFLEWWIDQDTGYPIEERKGKIRYLFIDGGNEIWGDTKEEVIKMAWHVLEPIVKASGIDPKEMVKSVSFVPGSIYDNKKLLEKNPAYLSNLLAQDEQTKAQLLDGNWKVKVSEDEIIDYYAFKDSFNNTFIESGEKYIIADIAMEGSDKYISGVFDGWRLEDIIILDKSSGKMIIDAIQMQQNQYKIPNRNVCYDSDGVGSFVGGEGGFISGSFAFHGGSTPFLIKVNGKYAKENYMNLKTQCAYHLGDQINNDGFYISERVANVMWDDKMTVKQRFLFERKAIKKYKTGHDGKLRILPKQEQRVMLNNSSPDLMDILIMRKAMDLQPKKVYNYTAVTF